MNLNATLFLSAAAVLYVVGDSLPKMSYLTKLDKLIVATITTIFSVTVETCVVYMIASGNEIVRHAIVNGNETFYTKVNETYYTDVARTLDIQFGLLMPATYAVINVFLFVPPLMQRRRQRFGSSRRPRRPRIESAATNPLDSQ
eukprot:COSAG01_NODE_39826_length_471_cov_1.887097_1_plen_143_part_01